MILPLEYKKYDVAPENFMTPDLKSTVKFYYSKEKLNLVKDIFSTLLFIRLIMMVIMIFCYAKFMIKIERIKFFAGIKHLHIK